MLREFNLNANQLNQFKIYAEFLLSENKKYNLTAIKDLNEVYLKHFYDSLKLSSYVDFNNINSFCDIGSGAGFPGIPIKIMFPNLELTIIEPTQKRCNFLSKLVSLLELKNVIIINDRSENIKEEQRDSFDIVSARAVASLPVLLELTIPYVKVGGYFLALKGRNYQEELDASKNALFELSSKVGAIYDYELPNELGSRTVIKVEKHKKTKNKYPRIFQKIKSKSL